MIVLRPEQVPGQLAELKEFLVDLRERLISCPAGTHRDIDDLLRWSRLLDQSIDVLQAGPAPGQRNKRIKRSRDMDVYFAGSYRYAEQFDRAADALAKCGIVTFRWWIKHAEEIRVGPDGRCLPSADPMVAQVHALDCRQAICHADVVIMMQPSGAATHVEMGIAVALLKNVWMVGQPERDECFYSLCKLRFATLDEAVQQIVGQAQVAAS